MKLVPTHRCTSLTSLAFVHAPAAPLGEEEAVRQINEFRDQTLLEGAQAYEKYLMEELQAEAPDVAADSTAAGNAATSK